MFTFVESGVVSQIFVLWSDLALYFIFCLVLWYFPSNLDIENVIKVCLICLFSKLNLKVSPFARLDAFLKCRKIVSH